MIKEKKKTKKKVFLNGVLKKIDYDAYMVIRQQEQQLMHHESALLKYVLIYQDKKKHSDDEKILYEYCMQLPGILSALENLKVEENEKENNS